MQDIILTTGIRNLANFADLGTWKIFLLTFSLTDNSYSVFSSSFIRKWITANL
jgi:hypothetical protein